MVTVHAWRERSPREGWDCRYTVIGGKRRGAAPFDDEVTRFVQQAFVAVPSKLMPSSEKAEAFARLCMRLLQRGRMPPVSPRLGDALTSIVGDPDPATAQDLLLQASMKWTLDPSIPLDPTFERPFWEHLAARPELARWVTPQASLEALARVNPGGGADRWADFLLAHPLVLTATVIEIDGAQHRRAAGVDKERDHLLRCAEVAVRRQPGQGWYGLFDDEPFASLLGAKPAPQAEARRRAALAPAIAHRFAYALLEGLRLGRLNAGSPWVVELEDPLDILDPCAGPALDLLASVDELYGFEVMPRRVTINGRRWQLEGGRFEATSDPDAAPATLRIILDPDRPPHAALPVQDGQTIVIRHAFLPVDLPFEIELGKRYPWARNPGPEVLGRLATDLFGVNNLRLGQADAMAKALTGRDALALMPTGGGKSLVYQLVGLLSPGLTIVVAPIVALIDDQNRRLRDQGIDRVLGLHGALKTPVEQQQIVADVVHRGALFAFVTPERLQIERFRRALSAAAQQRLIGLAVVDEAHCVSEWGHDFRTAYLRLGRTLRSLCEDTGGVRPPLLAMTGTASPAVQRDICRDLEIGEADILRSAQFDRPNLRYRVCRRLFGDKKALADEIQACGALPAEGPAAPRPGLVFNQSVNGQSGLLALRELTAHALGITTGAVEIYCGEPPDEFGVSKREWDRKKAEAAERFMLGQTNVMVATKAFGMGVDKNDIRWTVHAGMPGSIEAFAQEAGRAGRDGSEAMCVLVATLPPAPLVTNPEQLLAKVKKSDLNILDYFLQRAFAGEDVELSTSKAVLDELNQIAPTGAVRIPRSVVLRQTGTKGDEKSREKALYRLMLLGAVGDYTVDFGGNVFEVQLAQPSTQELDQALLKEVQRLDPGNSRHLRDLIRQAPDDISDRTEHHLAIVINMVYRRIRPARVRALFNMYRMVAEDLSEGEFRQRLNDYLGAGPLAAALATHVLDRPDVNVMEIIGAFDAVPADETWRGAVDRQLEDTPDHPVALLADALAEAWSPKGDRARFAEQLGKSLRTIHARGVPEAETAILVGWLLRQLDAQQEGRRRGWRIDVWQSVEGRLLGAEGLDEEERAVLRAAAASPDETELVLIRRIATAAGRFQEWAAE